MHMLKYIGQNYLGQFVKMIISDIRKELRTFKGLNKDN